MSSQDDDFKLTATVGHRRFSEQVAAWVRAALRRHAMGERICWDVTLHLVGTPNGPTPFVMLYLSTPSPLLGNLLGELVMVEPARATEPQIERAVADAVGKLMVARARAGAATNGQPPPS